MEKYAIIGTVKQRKEWDIPLFADCWEEFMEIAERVKKEVEGIIRENGYVLDHVEYVKENNVYYLRIVIDKEGYIDLDDCVKVTELINPIIDSLDYLKDNYTLDVCSKEKGWE